MTKGQKGPLKMVLKNWKKLDCLDAKAYNFHYNAELS